MVAPIYLLNTIPVLLLGQGVDDIYAAVRVALEKSGTPIGGNDLLIASQAMTMNLVVVTANEKEFRRIDGLRVENWFHNQTV